FNEMTAGLALKERYRSVLDLVADREVADDLIAGRLTLGGELREASVVFCDVRGFTALTERMEPGEVIALLNEHMTALTRVVYANGGVVDKFVGDQVIALFGVPRSTGHDAYAAVRAAREMIEARTTLNARAARALEAPGGLVRADLSGLLDLEGYYIDQRPPGLIFGSDTGFVNPRLTLFLDTRVGRHLYGFVEARFDRGFDPRSRFAAAHLDAYLARWTPLDTPLLNLQFGKFATLIGTWAQRDDSWGNSF